MPELLGSWPFALLGAVAGLLIGCVGIGGVIVVPALVYLFDVPVHAALAAAMFAFVPSGIVGTAVFTRNRSIRWDMAGWTWAGAMPAAFAGAMLATTVAPAMIEAAVGLLAAASGAHALLGAGEPDASREAEPSNRVLLGAGTFTGFASSLTGTGGPLVLIPILVWRKLPVLAAIGLAQAIQLPIAVLATAGFVVAGTLDVSIGAWIGAGIVAGTWAGARAAHALPRAVLRRIVAALLVVVGASILARAASGRDDPSAERQAHARDAAVRVVAVLERDRAAVVLDDLAAQHEADAGAARLRREERNP